MKLYVVLAAMFSLVVVTAVHAEDAEPAPVVVTGDSEAAKPEMVVTASSVKGKASMYPAIEGVTVPPQVLGAHAFCALATSGEFHHDQACRCVIKLHDKSTWTLEIRADRARPNSKCLCQAVCLD